MSSDSSFLAALVDAVDATIARLDPTTALVLSAAGLVSYAIYYAVQLVRRDRNIKRLGARAHMVYNNPFSGTAPSLLRPLRSTGY